jgi:uncharacterized protein YndB with AHSA1/START domain
MVGDLTYNDGLLIQDPRSPANAPRAGAGLCHEWRNEMSFQISLDIRRSPSDVFAFIADFRNMPRWYEAVERITATTPASARTGARFRMVRSLPGGAAQNDVEITSYQQYNEISFTSIHGPTPFRYRYRLQPVTTGTRLTLDGDISAEGLPGTAARFGTLANQLFKNGMKKNLQVLKQILESGH